MDWAEELKMSFSKTTARKGRRAKSREAVKDTTSTSLSVANVLSKINASHNTNNDIIQDITLDLQQTNSGFAYSSSLTPTPPSAPDTVNDSAGRRPPRRVLGGWATDNSVMKILKSKKNLLEDERFQHASATNPANSMQDDNIPIIPDLDDVKDEILMNEIVEPPNFFVDRVTLKELNLDLFSHHTFSVVDDADLTILTRCLKAQETLDEPDEVWEWEKLFTDVIAEIHSDKITAGNTSPSHIV